MLSLVQLFAFRHSICRPPKAEAWSGAMRGAHNYCRSLAKDRTQGCLIFSQHLWSLILGFYGGNLSHSALSTDLLHCPRVY